MLDALRQPLESGFITVARSVGVVRYPARLLLVLAANPCPCGGSESLGRSCECSALQRRRYLARLSGPLLDRVDIHLTLHAVPRADLLDDITRAESTAVVAHRVAGARVRMAARLAGTPWLTNSEVPGRELRRAFRIPAEGRAVLDQALRTGRLSARGVDRVLRVAWTLADLREHDVPTRDDVADAQHLRLNTLRKGTRHDARHRADDRPGAATVGS
jgi:magnesium chelatase family protein